VDQIILSCLANATPDPEDLWLAGRIRNLHGDSLGLLKRFEKRLEQVKDLFMAYV